MRLFSESISKYLMWSGIGLFIVGLTIFSWNSFDNWNIELKSDSAKLGQFGDFVGGIIGSLWAFAGVILFYVALTEQRADIQINRKVLKIQVNALKQQIKEFELQREEMELTREVFTEQSKTLKTQQFESTFFNSVNLLNNIIENISYSVTSSQNSSLAQMIDPPSDRTKTYQGRSSFKHLFENFRTIYHLNRRDYIIKYINPKYRPGDEVDLSREQMLIIVQKSYIKFYKNHESSLGHYFRTLYNIIKFVKESNNDKSKYYTNLIRSQLSKFEHLLLFYNCLSTYGEEKFKPLIINYSLLDNLPLDGLLHQEHKQFYPEQAYN